MEMLSNGYGCIKKCSKTLKQSIFDWMLHKFNSILTRTMSDIQSASTSVESTSVASSSTESISAASTSTASTSNAVASTSASTSQYYNSYNVVPSGDGDCTTTDDSELSSDEESLPVEGDDESANANEVDCTFDQSDDNMDDKSYMSWSTTSSTVSVWRKSSSENSETEKSILKEWTPDKPSSHNEDRFEDTTTTTPILILVQPPSETEGQMNEIGIDMINVEEHTKRLKELEKELDFIESTEWMYRPIDASIR